ncbi:MAG: hypothetical protein A2X34_09710 [Elusimicrobia bacterium GWC2_51_8]|nr:MAG: hypothetical protein A2X33_10160 [Elusimicrobia bacterium GWA2_51_34]OGR61140.1 MAG: hypothetical protein A2X34_09710 [Elusimicrobia bacterium GWC2_51_8]OGR84726.1 MAG: hypothetical protein A2021_03875 [Elusimicrobia bacterium GWF2_52_66]
MGYRERCFYGESKEIKLRLPGAMLTELNRLCIADERHSISNELTYLLGCKLESITYACQRQNDRKTRLKELESLEQRRATLWKAIIMAQREKDLDQLVTELRPLLSELLAAKEALDDVIVQPEEGMPVNWQEDRYAE